MPRTVNGAFKCFIAINPTCEVGMDEKTYNTPWADQRTEPKADVPTPCSRCGSPLYTPQPLGFHSALRKPRNSRCSRKMGAMMSFHGRCRCVCLPHTCIGNKSSGFQLQVPLGLAFGFWTRKNFVRKAERRQIKSMFIPNGQMNSHEPLQGHTGQRQKELSSYGPHG